MAIKKASVSKKAVSAVKEAVVSAVRKAPVAAPARKKVSEDELYRLIKEKAQEIYVLRGCSAGDSLDDWYKAEAIVKKEQGL